MISRGVVNGLVLFFPRGTLVQRITNVSSQVEVIAEDANGLKSTCTARVTVKDKTPPVISCSDTSYAIAPDANTTFTGR